MDKCSVAGCGRESTITWPLLTPEVGLCSKHHDNPPPKYRDLVKASKAPPDDFDIPVEDLDFKDLPNW